jgi:hypothetical protein
MPRPASRKRGNPYRVGMTSFLRGVEGAQMKEPLFWNTLDEAASWLSDATGHTWTDKEVLNAIWLTYGVKARKPLPDGTFAPLAAIRLVVFPPLDIKFGWYELAPGEGVTFQHNMGHQIMPLYQIHIAQLLAMGETDISIAKSPSSVGEKDVIVSVIGDPLRANLSMVRVTGDELQRLTSICKVENLSVDGTTDLKPSAPLPIAPLDIPLSNWKMKIQEQAANIWRRARTQGGNPTKNSIKDDLAKWCRDSKNDIRTPTGINPNSEYIARHVLRKWTPPND